VIETAIELSVEPSEIFAIAFDLVKASVVPAAVSIAALLLLRKFRAQVPPGQLIGVVFTIAYMAGYAAWRHDDRSAFVPSLTGPTETWLLYLAPFAAIVTIGIEMARVRDSRRYAMLLGASLLAAWLLVPSWPSLWPPRIVCIPLLAVYFVALALLLDALADRFSGPVFIAAVALAAGGLALLVSALSSMRYGQFLAVAAAALAGCAVISAFSRPSGSYRGVGFVYAMVVGGWAFVAGAYPMPPHYGYLLVAAAPLLLWAWVAIRAQR
jgi:hypothetical protein